MKKLIKWASWKFFKLSEWAFSRGLKDHIQVAIQINGKYSGRAFMPMDAMKKIYDHRDNRAVCVPGKLVNFVISK